MTCAVFVFAAFTNAQEAPTTNPKQPTKEEKQKMKEKQEADLAAAFKEIGLTDEEIQQVKDVMQKAGEKNAAARKNETLTDDQKQEQIKANNEEKNERIKQILGEERYKQFTEIRKKQKQAADMGTPKPAGN